MYGRGEGGGASQPPIVPYENWALDTALDGRPIQAGAPRPSGGDWAGWPGFVYDLGHKAAHTSLDGTKDGLGVWAKFQWRVPPTNAAYEQGYLNYEEVSFPLPFPYWFRRWVVVPLADYDGMEHQDVWCTSYVHPFRDSLSYRNYWGIDYARRPQGMGPKNRWHTTAYPDQEWARHFYPVYRQHGNRALALRGEDALPATPTYETRAELAKFLLFDEPTYDILGRYQPVYKEPYIRHLAVSHLVWWDHWKFLFTFRNVLRRAVRLGGAIGSSPQGPTLGWGGRAPSRGWAAVPGGTEGAGGVDSRLEIERGGLWGRSLVGPAGVLFWGPGQGRSGEFNPLRDRFQARKYHQRDWPWRIGPRRGYGGRRGGRRLTSRAWSRLGPSLDPSSLPWGLQAWLRGFDRRSAGDPWGPEVSWVGGLLAGLLGRSSWLSAQGWGGGLNLGPHIRRFHLGAWAPGQWVPLLQKKHIFYREATLNEISWTRWGAYPLSRKAGPQGPWAYRIRNQQKAFFFGLNVPPSFRRFTFYYFNPKVYYKTNPYVWEPKNIYLLPLFPFRFAPHLPIPPWPLSYPTPKDLFMPPRGCGGLGT